MQLQPTCTWVDKQHHVVNFIRKGCSRAEVVQAAVSRQLPVLARPWSEPMIHQQPIQTTAADQQELDDFLPPPLHEQRMDQQLPTACRLSQRMDSQHLCNNKNNITNYIVNNTNDNVYSAVITTEPLRKFTWFRQ